MIYFSLPRILSASPFFISVILQMGKKGVETDCSSIGLRETQKKAVLQL